MDMDGVLWQGSEPVVNIKRLFESIQEMGIQAFCVTNNSTRSISYYLDKLAGFGVSLDPSQIITSAEATAAFLATKYPQQGNIYVIGENGLREALKQRGFRIIGNGSQKEIVAVAVGLDQKCSYRDLALAVRYIQQGAFFVGTNPDLTIPTPTGPAPGAGTILKAIEVSSGVTPQIIGKPYPALFSLALSRANGLPEETIMIGDRLETDILGAQNMGLLTALVLSGISAMEQAGDWEPQPDIIAEDALQAIEEIRNKYG